MKRIRSAKINGHRWRFDWTKPHTGDLALCHHEKRVIQINPNVDNVTMMAIIADEICHCHFPSIDNDYVDLFSDDVAEVARRIGLISEDE